MKFSCLPPIEEKLALKASPHPQRGFWNDLGRALSRAQLCKVCWAQAREQEGGYQH